MFCMKMVRNWGAMLHFETNPHHITVDLFSAANVYHQPQLAWGSKWDTMWILASKNQRLAHDARKSSGETKTTNICSAHVPHVTSFKFLVFFNIRQYLHCVYIHIDVCAEGPESNSTWKVIAEASPAAELPWCRWNQCREQPSAKWDKGLASFARQPLSLLPQKMWVLWQFSNHRLAAKAAKVGDMEHLTGVQTLLPLVLGVCVKIRVPPVPLV